VLTTDQKGAIAESAITAAAVRAGVGVSRPIAPQRYDLVFDVGMSLLRVQCKWAALRQNVVIVRCRTCRRGPDGFVRRDYESSEIDAIAAFCEELGACYFLPIADFDRRSVIQLRLAPSRNNQRCGVNWAEDFDFAARLRNLLGP
jgi:hypothetical protein